MIRLSWQTSTTNIKNSIAPSPKAPSSKRCGSSPGRRYCKTSLFRFGLPTGFQGIAMNLAGVFLLRFIGSLQQSAAAQAADAAISAGALRHGRFKRCRRRHGTAAILEPFGIIHYHGVRVYRRLARRRRYPQPAPVRLHLSNTLAPSFSALPTL